MSLQVEFPYNTTCALKIEHTRFEANFDFSPYEPLDLVTDPLNSSLALGIHFRDAMAGDSTRLLADTRRRIE
jgi:hypothetical protein